MGRNLIPAFRSGSRSKSTFDVEVYSLVVNGPIRRPGRGNSRDVKKKLTSTSSLTWEGATSFSIDVKWLPNTFWRQLAIWRQIFADVATNQCLGRRPKVDVNRSSTSRRRFEIDVPAARVHWCITHRRKWTCVKRAIFIDEIHEHAMHAVHTRKFCCSEWQLSYIVYYIHIRTHSNMLSSFMCMQANDVGIWCVYTALDGVI